MTSRRNPEADRASLPLIFGLPVGAGIGAIIGVMLGDPLIGAAVGAPIGLLAGLGTTIALEQLRRRRNR